MADLVSALEGHCTAGQFGQPGETGLVVSEVKELTLTQLAAWPSTVSLVGAAGAKAIGASKAPGPGETVWAEHAAVLRVEPLKWWLIARGRTSIPSAKITAAQGAVLDLSHSRAWITISGAKATRFLNHFLPIDLRETSFPPGTVASTAFHHISVTLWRSGEGFNLLLQRSFTASLWELLHESALQYGLEIRDNSNQ